MYKIVETTDHKYLGMELEDITSKEIVFPDGFIMEVEFFKLLDDCVELGNSNYIILLRKE